LDCKSFANGPTFSNFDQSSTIANKGYFFHFTPNPGEYGVNYQRIGVVLQDNLHRGSHSNDPDTYISIYINVLPVNDAPNIFYIAVGGGVNEATNGQVVTIAHNISNLGIIDHISDDDGVASIPSYTASVNLSSSSSIGASFSYVINGKLTSGATTLTLTSTLSNVSSILKSIQVIAVNQGLVNLAVSVNDGGYSGGCPTGMTPQADGTCPRTTTIIFQISFTFSGVSFLTASAAAASAGAFFLVGVAAAVFIANKYKKKKDDDWKEFDEDNFKDVAERETQSSKPT